MLVNSGLFAASCRLVGRFGPPWQDDEWGAVCKTFFSLGIIVGFFSSSLLLYTLTTILWERCARCRWRPRHRSDPVMWHTAAKEWEREKTESQDSQVEADHTRASWGRHIGRETDRDAIGTGLGVCDIHLSHDSSPPPPLSLHSSLPTAALLLSLAADYRVRMAEGGGIGREGRAGGGCDDAGARIGGPVSVMMEMPSTLTTVSLQVPQHGSGGTV